MTTIKNDHLKFGSSDAPLKLEAFINVACPDSARIYHLAKEVLPPYIENGQIEAIVKLYDKPRRTSARCINSLDIRQCEPNRSIRCDWKTT